MDDSQLLQRYAERGCETSFAELVQRNVSLVFSAALRQVGGDRHLAEEVTQSVFTDLARKAKSLRDHPVLSGWLYTSTRFAAAKRVRAERRRSAREVEAVMMQESRTESDEAPHWAQMEVVLDSAMHDLAEKDRNAVLLRYFKGQTFEEVGATLGVTADAARMRVERALEKLRKEMAKRGVAPTIASLSIALTQQAASAAPIGLAGAITGTALGGAAAGASTTLAVLEILTMSKLKAGMVAIALAGVSVPLVVQRQTNRELQSRSHALAEQAEQIAEALEPLRTENARLKELLAQRTQAPPGASELHRLRDEVTRLRAEAQTKAARALAENPLQETLQSLATRAATLKQSLARMPEKGIPELRFLTEKDWLDAVAELETVDSEEEQRRGLSKLRASAKSRFGEKLRTGLRKYMEAHSGQVPDHILQLQHYMDEPVEAGLLERYRMTEASARRDGHDFISEAAPPVDEEFDTRFRFGINGTSSSSYSKSEALMNEAMADFARANDGRLPRSAAQLADYLREPVDLARIQKRLDKVPPQVTTIDQLRQGW